MIPGYFESKSTLIFAAARYGLLGKIATLIVSHTVKAIVSAWDDSAIDPQTVADQSESLPFPSEKHGI